MKILKFFFISLVLFISILIFMFSVLACCIMAFKIPIDLISILTTICGSLGVFVTMFIISKISKSSSLFLSFIFSLFLSFVIFLFTIFFNKNFFNFFNFVKIFMVFFSAFLGSFIGLRR